MQRPQTNFATAVRSRVYWLITGTFFVCGFHVSFLLAHMPGVIELCGLPPGLSGAWLAIIGGCNVAGSIVSGRLSQRTSMKRILAVLYALRAIGVVAFVLMPQSAEVLVVFSVWMGVTYMATLPPTIGLIAARFGTRHMGKLFGVTMLLHQVGAFLGVWLGGVSVEATGGYDLAWQVDAGLALAAAAMALAIAKRSRPVIRQAHGRLPGDRAEAGMPVVARPTPLRTGTA